MRTYLLPLLVALAGPGIARAETLPVPRAGPKPIAEATFRFDSFEVAPRERRELAAAVTWLAKHPTGRLVIEGHTDAIGTYAYNAGLAVRRAEAVRYALLRLGADADRLVVGIYGEAKPAYDGYAANRRVTVYGTKASLRTIEKRTLRDGVAVVWGYRPTGTATARNRRATRTLFAG